VAVEVEAVRHPELLVKQADLVVDPEESALAQAILLQLLRVKEITVVVMPVAVAVGALALLVVMVTAAQVVLDING
jgi:hypothetical protein